MTEENVYAEEKGTGGIATAKVEENTAQSKARSEEKASAVPEKFKDVDALARAYAALQSEFTRRSQRLKELERKVENFKTENREEGSGAEKLRKNAIARKRAAKAFDEFVAGVEGSDDRNGQQTTKPTDEEAAPPVQALENTDQPAEAVETVLKENEAAESAEYRLREDGRGSGEGGNVPEASVNAEKDSGRARQPVAESGSAALSPSEELYQTVSKNEKVRLRIIGEYLASIGRNGAPLTTGNVGTLATPPQRAKSIGVAGTMALQYLKTPFGKE